MGGSRFSVWLNAVILAFFLAALGATGSSDDDTNYLSSDDGVNQYATDIGWEGVLEFIRGGGNDGGPVEGGRADNRASRREEVSAHHQPHEPAAPPRPVYVSLPEYGDMEGRRESSPRPSHPRDGIPQSSTPLSPGRTAGNRSIQLSIPWQKEKI